jgi:hypothetical protein
MAALGGRALGEDDPVRKVLSGLAKPEPTRPAPKVDIRLKAAADPAPQAAPARTWRIGRSWGIGAATIVLVAAIGLAVREVGRRGLEHQRTALLARVIPSSRARADQPGTPGLEAR